MAPDSELREAGEAVRAAVILLAPHLPFLKRFAEEAGELAAFGPVLAPGLFIRAINEPWREDVREQFAAAARFVEESAAVQARFQTRFGGTEVG